jgi:hypothetical protein
MRGGSAACKANAPAESQTARTWIACEPIFTLHPYAPVSEAVLSNLKTGIERALILSFERKSLPMRLA